MTWVAIILLHAPWGLATAEARATSLTHCWFRVAGAVAHSRANPDAPQLGLAFCKQRKGAIRT